MAAATTGSPKISPQAVNGLLDVTITEPAFVAGGDELEEQVGGLGVEGDVAHLVDDDQRCALQLAEVGLQMLLVVGCGQPHHPLGRRRELDPVASQAGLHPQRHRQMGLPGARRTEEDHVVPGLDEGQSGQVEHHLLAHAGLVGEVELLDRLAGREVSGADASLPALGLPGQDLLIEERGQEVLVAPALVAGLLGDPGDGLGDARRFHLADEVGQVVHAGHLLRQQGVIDAEVPLLDPQRGLPGQFQARHQSRGRLEGCGSPCARTRGASDVREA